MFITVGLYISSLYHYLLFHFLAEFFSIVVGYSFFFIIWNSYQYVQNSYFLFTGIAYLFVSSIDFVHTIAFKGMPIFDYPFYANQLWIAARSLESVSLLVGFILLKKNVVIKRKIIFSIFALITALFFLSIFYWKIFPICFVANEGQTLFKIVAEYVICFILLINIFLLRNLRDRFSPRIYRLLLASIISTIISETMFTLYVSNYDIANLLGHYFKIISFYLIYRAAIQHGLQEPYDFIFKELSSTKDKLQTLIEMLPISMFETNKDGQVIYQNKKMQQTFRKSLPFSIYELIPCSQEMEDKKNIENCECHIVNQKGETMTVLFYREKYCDNSIGLLVDITELKKTEERLIQKNKEIEQFAYAASHDLKSPLIMVKGFLQILENKLFSQRVLTPEIKEYIEFMSRALKRMTDLISDLLQYAVISEKKVSLKQIDLNTVLQTVKENLKQEILSSQAVIEYEKLPTVLGTETYWIQVFQNLIGNAIKYRKKEINPYIKIMTVSLSQSLLLIIKDNGIGIAREDLDKVFKPFVRLHTYDEIEGSGIGLATCKKIIETFGGQIWVESELGVGSSFFISLPIQEN